MTRALVGLVMAGVLLVPACTGNPSPADATGCGVPSPRRRGGPNHRLPPLRRGRGLGRHLRRHPGLAGGGDRARRASRRPGLGIGAGAGGRRPRRPHRRSRFRPLPLERCRVGSPGARRRRRGAHHPGHRRGRSLGGVGRPLHRPGQPGPGRRGVLGAVRPDDGDRLGLHGQRGRRGSRRSGLGRHQRRRSGPPGRRRDLVAARSLHRGAAQRPGTRHGRRPPGRGMGDHPAGGYPSQRVGSRTRPAGDPSRPPGGHRRRGVGGRTPEGVWPASTERLAPGRRCRRPSRTWRR